MSSSVTPAARKALVAALRDRELAAPEIRAITGWEAPKMSIRLALASIAKAENLELTAEWAEDSEGRDRLWFHFVEPKKPANANSKPVAKAAASAIKRSSRKSA